MNNPYIKWDPIAKRYIAVVPEDRAGSRIGFRKYQQGEDGRSPPDGDRMMQSKWPKKAGEDTVAMEDVWDGNPPGPADIPLKRKPNNRVKGTARINQVHRLAKRDGWTCHWCGVDLSLNIRIPQEDEANLRHPTIDHIIEKSKGGGNADDNCVLACLPCNSSRSNPKGEVASEHD